MAVDSGSNEIINENVNIASADQSDDMVTFMDADLYEAAKKSEFDDFKEKAKEDLNLLLTPYKNTILHINIISTTYNRSTKKKSESATFLGQILEWCPQLLNQVNIKGDTSLHVAARYGHVPALKLFIERAKKLAPHNHNDTENGVEEARQVLRMTNKKKETALHLAVRHAHEEAVTLLTKEDPDFPHSPNNSGETPLYLAANNYFTSKIVRAWHMMGLMVERLYLQRLLKATEKEIEDLMEQVGFAPYPERLIRRGFAEKDNRISKARDSHLVVAALMATVTFAAGFTLPGGYKNENGPNQGTAILSRNSAFSAFVISNAIAMMLSFSSVFLHLFRAVEGSFKIVALIRYSTIFTMLAMASVVVAFVTGLFAVLTTSSWLAITISFIGLSFYLILYYVLKKSV